MVPQILGRTPSIQELTVFPSLNAPIYNPIIKFLPKHAFLLSVNSILSVPGTKDLEATCPGSVLVAVDLSRAPSISSVEI